MPLCMGGVNTAHAPREVSCPDLTFCPSVLGPKDFHRALCQGVPLPEKRPSSRRRVEVLAQPRRRGAVARSWRTEHLVQWNDDALLPTSQGSLPSKGGVRAWRAERQRLGLGDVVSEEERRLPQNNRRADESCFMKSTLSPPPRAPLLGALSLKKGALVASDARSQKGHTLDDEMSRVALLAMPQAILPDPRRRACGGDEVELDLSSVSLDHAVGEIAALSVRGVASKTRIKQLEEEPLQHSGQPAPPLLCPRCASSPTRLRRGGRCLACRMPSHRRQLDQDHLEAMAEPANHGAVAASWRTHADPLGLPVDGNGGIGGIAARAAARAAAHHVDAEDEVFGPRRVDLDGSNDGGSAVDRESSVNCNLPVARFRDVVQGP